MNKVLRICAGVMATVTITIVLFMAMLNALDKELEIQAEKNRAWVAEYCKENRKECN